MSCKLRDLTNVSKNIRRLTSDKRKTEGPTQLASFTTILKSSNSVKLLEFSSHSWDTPFLARKNNIVSFVVWTFTFFPHPCRRGNKLSDRLKKKLPFFNSKTVVNPFSSDHMHFTCVAARHKFSVPLTRRLLAHRQYARGSPAVARCFCSTLYVWNPPVFPMPNTEHSRCYIHKYLLPHAT